MEVETCEGSEGQQEEFLQEQQQEDLENMSLHLLMKDTEKAEMLNASFTLVFTNTV